MSDRTSPLPHNTSPFTAQRRRKAAFTLVEVVVVVVVIALLAAIAVVSYNAVTNNTYDASAEVTVASLAREVATLGTFDLEISEDDVLAAAADVPSVGVAGSNGESDWTLQETPGVPSTVVGSIGWVLQGDAVGFAVLTQPGHAVYGCATLNYTDTRIDKTDTVSADPADGLPCTPARYSGEEPPSTAPPTGPYPITAVGGDATIEVTWPIVADVASYNVECWTGAQGEGGGTYTVATALSTSIVLYEMENYVWHTCRVTATLSDTSTRPSDTATALPAGTPVSPVGEDVEFDPETDFGFCPSCTDHPFEAPTNPSAEGLWDLSSFYSTHAGDHRLYAVDRGTGAVITVLDTGAPSVSAQRIGFREAGSSAPVAFDQPSGLAYGSHPARRAASSSTSLFSVIYLTDAADGTVWMLDVKAARAYQVATGFTAPTGVTWSMCANPTTGADETTVEGAVECLYVSTTAGIFRVPLTTTVDANGSNQPVATTAAASVQVSPTASVKVFATSATLLSGETSSVALRNTYGSTAAATATGTGASGAVLIPESISGVAGGLVVFADAGTHQIKRFGLNTPGAVTVIAGSGVAGYADATGLAAQFNAPRTVHSHGNWPFVYVADTGNGAIRKLNVVTGAVTTVYGTPTTTFAATGACQTLTVEAGKTFMVATLSGAQGGTTVHGNGGLGGRIRASIPVTAGETLQICVGRQGSTFNGGGATVSGVGPGGGGTDIRRDSNTDGTYSWDERILIAGGGGGGGSYTVCTGYPPGYNGAPGSGGPVGGSVYEAGRLFGGQGAVDAHGGFAGVSNWAATPATDGTLGIGGVGSRDGSGCSARGGGGGGGGWYGGGGGGYSGNTVAAVRISDGGGGGNGYADPSASAISTWTGVQSGHGIAQISYPDTAPAVTATTTRDTSRTFQCVEGPQMFRVPVGVTTVAADLSGAQGGENPAVNGNGGRGGRISGNITALTPGDAIQVNVGCQGNSTRPGWNGGGSQPGVGTWQYGGGAADLRLDSNANNAFALDERIMVAGGGGGFGRTGGCTSTAGSDGGHGSGGSLGGFPEYMFGGEPAFGDVGGLGATTGPTAYSGDGTFGVGGAGSYPTSGCSYSGGSGGGGGWYGGGGGGAMVVTSVSPGRYSGSGGGGGNGYAAPNIDMVSTWTGTQESHGIVTLDWEELHSFIAATADETYPQLALSCASRPQRVRVPVGITELTATMVGAASEPTRGARYGLAGEGGSTTATMAVSAGDMLEANIACQAESGRVSYNGGVTQSSRPGWSGGAADLRTDVNGDLTYDLTERAIVAGGGGGAGTRSTSGSASNNGGHGGPIGTTGAVSGGTGGTQVAGGLGVSGAPTADGTFGTGGLGTWNGLGSSSFAEGGGGGGGWYGGGAGGALGSGGGGGSSYASTLTSNPSFVTGGNTANGYGTITFTP